MKRKKRRLKKPVKYFLIAIILLIVVLIIPKPSFKQKEKPKEETKPVSINIEQKEIKSETSSFLMNIKYPYYNVHEIDNAINGFITKLTYDITSSTKYSKLTINYEIIEIEDYDYLIFGISNSLDKNLLYKTFLINRKTFEINKYSDIIDTHKLKSLTTQKLKNRYSSKVIESIKKTDFNTLTYQINKDGINIYFYDLKPKNMTYVPYVKFTTEELTDVFKVDITFEKTFKERKINKTKYVALTFDDGPGEYTEEILDILKEYDAKVTFFAQGYLMKSYSKVIKREVSEGHEVASHTYNHKNLTELTDADILDQINTTNIIFNNITGKSIKYVRPPYGEYNSKVSSLVRYPLILWNVDSKDWEYQDSTKTANWVLKKVSDGSIVLMHDIHKINIDSLKQMLPELVQRGYNFITITEMAEMNNVTLKKGEAYRYIN